MWLWNEFWCLSWHGVYTICIYSCADPEGGGSGPPPEKVQKYMVSLKLFLAILARNTLKSQSYQSSIQCLALIGPPAKRHLNGVSLTGHWWPVNSGIWILPPLIKLKTKKQKKPVKVGPPLTQLPGPRMFIQLPNDEHNYIFFIHQYDVCISKNSCTYQPSNQAIKVAIKIQGCEQGRRRYIYI